MRQKKYEIIRNELDNRIRQGIIPAGSKLPSEQILAEEYGVSRLTVRQALSSLSQAGLIRTIQGSGTFAQQCDSAGPAELKCIHFICNSCHDVLYRSQMLGLFILHMAEWLNRDGYSLTVSLLPRHQTTENFIHEKGLLPTFNGGVLSGLPLTAELVELLSKKNIPHISMSQPLPGVPCPHVGNDLYGAVHTCIDKLYSFGHRHIGVIVEDVILRDEATRALAKYGLELPDSAVGLAAGVNDQGGATAVMELLHRRPDLTGLMIFGDQAASGAVRKMLDNNLRVPIDISVAVLDRYNWMDTLFPFQLSGAQADLEGIAIESIKLFREQRACRAYPPKQLNLPATWVPGESIGFPRDWELKLT